jgi:predicted membrane-bound spermidine synthase
VLYFLLFMEGFIGLTYQLLFFRQLTPAVGSSSSVDAWIIGIFLGALSVGYFTGGKEHPDPLEKLGRNLIATAIIGGILMSSAVIDAYFQVTVSAGASRMVALVMYTLVAVAPIAFFMGQALPLIMQRKTIGKSAAEQGGNAFALSTVGSMAGAILPITLLTPFVGATLTLAANTGIASLIGLYLIRKKPLYHIAVSLSLIGIAHAVLLAPYWALPKGQFTSSIYADIYLLESESRGEKEKILYANGSYMSTQDMKGNNNSSYIDAFQEKIISLGIERQDILVLGAGGFMAHMHNPGNNRFTYVDIDGALKAWAEKYFNFDPETANVVIEDARAYMLSQSDDSVPILFMDVFSANFDSPEHLMTTEFFQLIRQKLQPDGVMIFNAIQSSTFDSRMSRALHNTVQSVFGFCHIRQVSPGKGRANLLYTCFNVEENTPLYTDDKNTISRDAWTSSQ